jgi:hypothetical protein
MISNFSRIKYVGVIVINGNKVDNKIRRLIFAGNAY